MKADISDDRLYLVCHDCRRVLYLARVWPFTQANFRATTSDDIAEHATCEHEFCYSEAADKWRAEFQIEPD